MVQASAARFSSRPWKFGLLLVALTLAWVAIAGGGTAQAWFCKPSGIYTDWQHWDHWHTFEHHDYIDGHTHSNGRHHHIWYIFGGPNAGYVHADCGSVYELSSAGES